MKQFVIIGLVIALLAAGCVQTKDVPSTADNTLENTKTVVVDEPIIDEAEEDSKITGAFVSGSTEILSDVRCDENRVVTLTFTNTGIETVRVIDVDFIANGNLDQTPECDADVLAPGESTLCSGLNALGVGKTNVVQAIMPDRVQALKKVTCE